MPRADGLANGSGWMKGPEFVAYMQHFVKHSKSSKAAPKLLLLDNHASHLCLDALQYADALRKAPQWTPAPKPNRSSKKQKPDKPPVQPPKHNTTEDNEDEDFCTICFKSMPATLTRFNSITCIDCQRPVHLKCANMHAGYYICTHCEADSEVWSFFPILINYFQLISICFF